MARVLCSPGEKCLLMPTAALSVERTLAHAIAARAGVDVYSCVQCRRCSSGCPIVQHMDLAPSQVMRAVQLGRRDVLRSRAIWLCSSCHTCTARCPQDLDVARVFETLRLIAQEERLPPAVPPVAMFSRSALRSIRLFGRLYELGLMAELYLRLAAARLLDLRQLLRSDIPMATKMLLRGKLKLLPALARKRRGAVPAMGPAALQVGYYPGCSLHGTAEDLGLSTRAVAQELGLQLVEPEGWICCGTSPAHTTDHTLATVLPVRNLALVQAAGQRCVTMPCASCYERTKAAIYDMQREPALRAAVERETGYAYDGRLQVEHLLETLERRVGLQAIARRVRRPLGGLRVVCYYGCLLTRPPRVVGQPHPEYPRSMDRLVEVLGAQALDWSYKTDCCGGALGLSQVSLMLELANKILADAQGVGAEAVVVACPLCQANLDLRQDQLHLARRPMPIIYITELMGLAFGLQPQALGLRKHLADPLPLLRAKGVVGAVSEPS